MNVHPTLSTMPAEHSIESPRVPAVTIRVDDVARPAPRGATQQLQPGSRRHRHTAGQKMRSVVVARAIVAVGVVLLAGAGCGESPPLEPCRLGGPIGTICGFENPEDIEYVPSADIIIATNMRFDQRDGAGTPRGGFLSRLVPGATEGLRVWPTDGADDAVLDPDHGDPSCTTPPARGAFYPHGLTSAERDDAALLYVVGHEGEQGGREAIEIFEVTPSTDGALVTWKGCIPLEPGVTGNDLAVGGTGEIFISNYQPSASLWHTIKANALGMATGDVRGWQRERGWWRLPHTRARQANGMAISPDGGTLFYTETGTGRVYRVPLRGAGSRSFVSVGGNPDNLAWSRRGKLLVATHTGGARLLACALGRSPCRTSWEIHQIDPETMVPTLLLSHDGSVLGAVSTPLDAAGRLYLGSIYGDRIGVVPAPVL